MKEHVQDLTTYGVNQLSRIDEVKILGNPKVRSGIISFVVQDIHAHDVASFLNQDGLAVRAGMHCTQPLLAHMGESSTVRASFSIYNTKADIDKLVDSLKSLIDFWK